MKFKFCQVINLPKEMDEIYFDVSKNEKLHPGDIIFLHSICSQLNNNLENSNFNNVVYVGLKKLGLKNNEKYGILLNWREKIFLSPDIQILLTLQNSYKNIDPFKKIRSSSIILVNKEIASSPLRIIGRIYEIKKFEQILLENKFKLIYIGKRIYKNSHYIESINGFNKCKEFISRNKPDAILTFDNYWMHYCLSKSINCLVVQRIKFTRNNYKNHVLHLNKVCGNKLFYVN